MYKFGVFGSGGKSKHAVSSFENPLYDVGPSLSLATNDENNASGSGYMDVGGNGAGNGYMDVSVNNAADVDDDGLYADIDEDPAPHFSLGNDDYDDSEEDV